ncbi:hypothetical protein D3C81_2103350 [compost metagenome]
MLLAGFIHPVFEALAVDFAVTVNLDFQPLGQCIGDGSSDAVQTTRLFVAGTAEFAARMQDCKDYLRGGHSSLMHSGRYAPSVIDYGN